MKILFTVVALLAVGWASAATRVLKSKRKKGKGEGKGKGKDRGRGRGRGKGKGKGKAACFETVYDAAAIGNKILAGFWADVHTTGCEPAGIAKAISKVFAKDITLSIAGGSPIAVGIDAAIELLVGAEGIDGSLTDLCLNHFVSWYGYGAVTGDLYPDNTFVLLANELTSPQAAVTIPIGREYTIAVDKKCGGIIIAVNIVNPFNISLGYTVPTASPTAVSPTSMVPTASPAAVSPTRPPSDTPYPTGTPTTTPLLSWVVAGGPFAALSNTVALIDRFMAVGDLTTDVGSVQSYVNNNGAWEFFQDQQGEQTGGRFGFDVSIAERAMLVGAPGIFIERTTVPGGAAYYYEYDRTSLEWLQLGSVMKSDGDFVSANEQFGYSVDLSATSRVVIGAPGSNSVEFGAAVGRVYSFEFQQVDSTSPEFDWLPMQDISIKGTQANEMLGSAVAISTDGNLFVAGAPGSGSGMGEVFLYEWVVDSWQELGSVFGEGLEALGTAVSILADDGSVFAVGAPGFGNGRGVVRVYSTEQSGARARDFLQIGPDIVGDAGEQLGARNSISGFAESADTPIVILSTASGSVKRLEYDESKGEWVSRFEVILSSGVTASASAVDTVAAIGGGTVAIYEPDANPTPTTPAPTPTTSATGPTGIPTPVPNPVRVVGGPFAGTVSTSFGRSVDISSIIMAVGAAASDFGQTFLYQFTGTGWEELSESTLTGDQVRGRFGSDVAVTGDEVLVGASGVFADQTITPTGVAYYYQRQADNTFTQVGSTLRGDEDFFAPLEAFGTSVAASVNRRVVIGAPGSNVGGVAQVGRVYPFEFDVDTQDWVRMQDTPIAGSQNDNLGVTVDISNDGSKFVVGAPSNDAGYFEVFVWNDSLSPPEWESVFIRAGSENSEGFGSGVSMIAANGSLFAVGGPNYMGGQGVIRVYEEGSNGRYSQVGPDIVGEVGEALGARNTFSGDGMTVIAGTANGFAKRFDYDEVLDEWLQLYDPIDTGFASVAGVAVTDAGNTFVAAGSSQATVFEFS